MSYPNNNFPDPPWIGNPDYEKREPTVYRDEDGNYYTDEEEDCEDFEEDSADEEYDGYDYDDGLNFYDDED